MGVWRWIGKGKGGDRNKQVNGEERTPRGEGCKEEKRGMGKGRGTGPPPLPVSTPSPPPQELQQNYHKIRTGKELELEWKSTRIVCQPEQNWSRNRTEYNRIRIG